MTEKLDKASKFTKETLVPIGLVIGICGLIWTASADRTRAWGLIEQHTRSIEALQADQQYMKEALMRIEAKLGTKP